MANESPEHPFVKLRRNILQLNDVCQFTETERTCIMIYKNLKHAELQQQTCFRINVDTPDKSQDGNIYWQRISACSSFYHMHLFLLVILWIS